MNDLQLKFMKLEKGESSHVKQKPKEGEKREYVHWCIWCYSIGHLKKDCLSHKEVLERKIIFY